MDVSKTDAMAQALRVLGEHFDHVQILVTWTEQGTSQRLFNGGGNWYARQGMAHDFIKCDEAQTNASIMKDALHKPDNDGEDWKP